MATIKMVAERANVSTATVSRVLNGHPSCTEETKQRVQKAIAELGYQPNIIAQSLRRQKTGTFITVVNDIRNPVFSDMIRGMEDVAYEHGYSMLIGNANDSRQRESTYLQYLQARKVDGIVLVTPRAKMEDILHLAQHTHMVLINEAREQNQVPVVGIDDYAAVWDLTAYAVGAGYKNLAYITGDLKTGIAQRRNAAFIEYTNKNNISAQHIEGGASIQHGYEGLRQMIESEKKPDCVLCYNDEVAIGALQYARDAGIRVPGDIAFCGFDDIPTASMLTPALTTVSQPTYKVGWKAASVLLDVLAGKKPPAAPVYLPYTLRIRETT